MSEPTKKYEFVACGESCGRVTIELTQIEFRAIERLVDAYGAIGHESYSPSIDIREVKTQ